MLFRQDHLKGIRDGEITLAFRKWKRPAVKKGSLIKTAIGQVEILDVSRASLADVTEKEATEAGFEKREDLMDIVNSKREGELYRISLRYHSPDPRIALRSQTNLSDEEFSLIKEKLARLDRYSKSGKWTIATLEIIRDHPQLLARHLAAKLQLEKDVFKLNVRKLKNLGLTISHEVGYSLSPLGDKFLSFLKREGEK